MAGYTHMKSMTDLLELLVSLNPWWSGRDFATGVRRERYFSKIKRYLASGEIVVLSGVRRSGKTTLLYQVVDDLIHGQGVEPRKVLFVNCDEPEIARLDRPLETVLETYRKEVCGEEGAFLVFDEIQNIPGWERWIKSVYDRKQFRLVISGSSSYLLDSELSTLISGRYLAIPVYPLDFNEYLLFNGVEVAATPSRWLIGSISLCRCSGSTWTKAVFRRLCGRPTRWSEKTSLRHTTIASSTATLSR